MLSNFNHRMKPLVLCQFNPRVYYTYSKLQRSYAHLKVYAWRRYEIYMYLKFVGIHKYNLENIVSLFDK